MVAAQREVAARIEHVGDAAGHTRGEIPSGPSEHDHSPARHVFAAVVADAFHDRGGAAVPHGKSLARDAADIGLSAGRAVEHHVADDDVVSGDQARAARRHAR